MSDKYRGIDAVELEGELHRQFLLQAFRELHEMAHKLHEGSFRYGWESCLEETEIRMRVLCEEHNVTTKLLSELDKEAPKEEL